MRKTLKIATVAAVLFLALGAIVFVYANSQNNLNTTDNELQTTMQNYFSSNNTLPPCNRRGMRQFEENRLQLGLNFFENATLNTVQGTVVSQSKGMLILDTGSGQIRVLVPKAWTLSNEVVSRATLFNGTFASAGQSITIKVLESNVFSNTSFSINVMLGYEAINSTNVHAYAVLPFNIVPSS
ncbi:hypothetical protein MUP77_20460 [Candidatus Bathyarchaeota archaeon]|jgi:hypothetical protein|nr:hypothetical protein [Candidatus Bathyarchaeota archaeon]